MVDQKCIGRPSVVLSKTHLGTFEFSRFHPWRMSLLRDKLQPTHLNGQCVRFKWLPVPFEAIWVILSCYLSDCPTSHISGQCHAFSTVGKKMHLPDTHKWDSISWNLEWAEVPRRVMACVCLIMNCAYERERACNSVHTQFQWLYPREESAWPVCDLSADNFGWFFQWQHEQ